MTKDRKPEKKSAIQAMFDAQKIVFGPMVFQAVKAMCDLGVLAIISAAKDQGITLEEISDKLDLSVYSIKVLLELGLSSEIVLLKNDRYHISKTGHFLLNDKLTQVNLNFVHDVCYQAMFNLKDSLQQQRPVGLKVFGEWKTIYEGLSSLPTQVQESWFAFDHYYSDMAFPDVLPLVLHTKPKLILDVGGNTGKWAIQCANYSKDVRVIIMDLEGQLEKAMQNVQSHDLEERITGIAANMLDDLPAIPNKIDVIWMSQFLDCFSEQQIESMLERLRELMDDETILYVLELFWDRQRFEATEFSLHNTSLYFTCIANGVSKMYHSEDMLKLIETAGYSVTAETDHIGIGHTLLECRKK
jgi:ubiquinone/menaquinone biosynthesis C-methylase UbiE|tara:strand:- start:416 stop:1486 length:1071 start_codon:yes stop_codon:yes gene_type:complete